MTHADLGPTGRSTRSESTGNLPGLQAPPAPPGGCQYETGMAYPKRRMPYALGGDPLEKVSGLKKRLSAEEEKKLTGDMRELYDRLLPSADSEDRRARFLRKLERLFREQWPGAEIQVRVFGSSGNLLCTDESDGG